MPAQKKPQAVHSAMIEMAAPPIRAVERAIDQAAESLVDVFGPQKIMPTSSAASVSDYEMKTA
jgi:hypothetical protein